MFAILVKDLEEENLNKKNFQVFPFPEINLFFFFQVLLSPFIAECIEAFNVYIKLDGLRKQTGARMGRILKTLWKHSWKLNSSDIESRLGSSRLLMKLALPLMDFSNVSCFRSKWGKIKFSWDEKDLFKLIRAREMSFLWIFRSVNTEVKSISRQT